MAAIAPNRPWLEQSDWRPEHPVFEALDPHKVEFVYNADLDELVVLYYGRDRRYSTHPASEHASDLIDPMTGEAVGMMFHSFMMAVKHSPPVIAVLAFATILGDDNIQEPFINGLRTQAESRPGFRERVSRALDVLRGETHRVIDKEKIESLKAIEMLVHPMGC